MEQKLAELGKDKVVKTNTQVWKIQQIWKKIPKTDFNKETDPLKKMQLKGLLYTKIEELYESQEGRKIKRSTVRRCVNSLTNKAK